jgi:hypothetical protein
MGIRFSITTELGFRQLPHPKENLIAKEGMASLCHETLDASRCGVGAQGLGVAQGAFDEAVKFAVSVYSSAIRSSVSRLSSICLPTWPLRSKRPVRSFIPLPALSTAAQRMFERIRHGEDFCDRLGHEGYHKCASGHWAVPAT